MRGEDRCHEETLLLYSEKVPLGEVIQDANRYFAMKILIPDERTRGIPYTGTVFVRSMEEWLDALTLNYPVRAITAPGGDIVLEPAESRIE